MIRILIRVVLKLDNLRIIRLKDSTYLRLLYRYRAGKKINLKNPKTFNEKLQWLKLYDRKDIYTVMVDKYEAKKYVSDIIGEEYIIPTLDVFDRFEEIDFDKLPNQFVIKCTHDSGGLVICKDKKNLDISAARKKINKSLKKNYYYSSREWPYKNVVPRIIIEKYMEDKNQKNIRDYKFFCFNGAPEFMYISEGLENHETARMQFFDVKFNTIELKRKDYNLFNEKPVRPLNYDKMIELSKKLSKDIPHVRVDWYEINGKIYFGELTFFTCSGFIPFENMEWDYKLGEMLKLPNKEGK